MIRHEAVLQEPYLGVPDRDLGMTEICVQRYNIFQTYANF